MTVEQVIGPLQKHPKESELQYYKRIFQKPVGEKEEEFETRVNIIKKCLPSLSVWQDNAYKKYVTSIQDKPTGYSEVN